METMEPVTTETVKMTGSGVFNILMTTLLAILGIKLAQIIFRQYFYWRRRNVPELLTMPIIGSAWRIILRITTFPEWVMIIYNQFHYARYVGIMDFATPALLIRDPEIIKEIAVKSFDNFPDHRAFVSEEMDPLFGKNIFSLKGDRWREMRALLSPSFTASKMKFMFELVSKCSRDFVKYLLEHPETWNSIESKDLCSRYTNDVIATVAFGISVNSLKDRNNEFFLKGKDTANFNSPWRMIKFIMFRMSPRLSRWIGLTFLPHDVTQFFINVVSETVKMRDEKGIVRPDMIHLLMQARDKENGHQMTIDDIVAQAFIFFLAGFDTSSTSMCYILHELAVNPDIQDKLYEEVERTLQEGNGEINYDALSKMEYMDMIVSEALRKYPSLGLVDRVTKNKFDLPPPIPGGKIVTVEPNTTMWFPVYALHHDPQYFPDPEKFDPERFNEQNKDKINPYTYLPFGVGPRKCIGNRFALMEIKIMIAHILQAFVLKRTEKTIHPVQFAGGSITLIAKGGFWIGLEKRKT